MRNVNPLDLIPPPYVIRHYLAKTTRECQRLRSLLRLSIQIEGDMKFLSRPEDQDEKDKSFLH